MSAFLNRLWLHMGLAADKITLALIAIGVALAMISGILGVHSVLWTGKVAGTAIEGFPPDTVKQVGYIWAPNWGLASLITLPAAVYYLLNARAAVEPLISTLVQTRMLRRRDGEVLDEATVLTEWEKESRVFTVFALMFLVFVFLYIMGDDFFQVVFRWLVLLTPQEIATYLTDPENPVRLNDSLYEFDWSVAALLEPTRGGPWANMAFSLVAYLIVPVLGAGGLLAGFCWFFSICFFFSSNRMARQGIIIVPDIDSNDARCGFEVFEPMFDHLLKASIFTAILALSMHLQNVFLRAPGVETIFDMVFGNSIEVAKRMVAGDLTQASDAFVFMGTALQLDPQSISIQTYISAFALLLMGLIVVGVVWFWLRSTALIGRDYLEQTSTFDEEQQQKLDEMAVWPIGWVSINFLLLFSGLVFLAMFFVNLISFLLVLFVLVSVGKLLNSLRHWSDPAERRRRKRESHRK